MKPRPVGIAVAQCCIEGTMRESLVVLLDDGRLYERYTDARNVERWRPLDDVPWEN